MEQKRTPTQYVYSLLFFMAGLFFLALGVSFSVNAQLGISPVSSIPYVVSLITSISLGTCVTAVYALFLLIQILLLRRKFKWFQLAQVLCASLFGCFVDLTQWILGDFMIPTLVGRFIMLLLMIVLCGFGLTLYVSASLISLPTEGLVSTIAQISTAPFPKVKTIVDCLYVLISILLSLLFFHNIEGIGLGTVLPALLLGKTMAMFNVPVTPIINKYCFGIEDHATQKR